jgi:hypothetical protein
MDDREGGSQLLLLLLLQYVPCLSSQLAITPLELKQRKKTTQLVLPRWITLHLALETKKLLRIVQVRNAEKGNFFITFSI